MYVTKIKMKPGCYYSSNLVEIDELYITECAQPGYYKKAIVHDYVKNHPNSIKVYKYPYPALISATSVNGEKYVRSSPNGSTSDNLLSLPREAG